MSGTANELVGASVAKRSASASAPRLAHAGQERGSPDTAPLDQSVYLSAARSCLPRWLRLLGSAPWSHDRVLGPISPHADTSLLYRQQAVTLAIATLCELDSQRSDVAYLRELVRASLVRWQLSLGGDGRPLYRRRRGSPLHAAIVGHVLQLLSETAGFQTRMLLDDIEKHLQWLNRRRPLTPWLEAAAVCALADGAVLVRDGDLLEKARNRLGALLARQHDEGWFPERGGADIGRLSLTVDALARMYRQNNWAELREPLRRMLGFMVHFVHPRGGAGGCYGSCDTAFVSPYGAELMAPAFADAASLALVCRRRAAATGPVLSEGSDDDSCAALGASLAMAGANAAPRLPDQCIYPHEKPGHTRFPGAGLSVFATKAYHAVAAANKGGSLHVTWRNGAADLVDSGVIAVYPHGTRRAAARDPRSRQSVTDSTVTCSGILRRTPTAKRRPRSRLRRLIGRILRRKRALKTPATIGYGSGRIDYQRLTHDLYDRHITFGEDWIRIRDRTHCRLPCETIVVQAPTPAPEGPMGGCGYCNTPARAPLFVDGGRSVVITRIYRNGQLIDHHSGAKAEQYRQHRGA